MIQQVGKMEKRFSKSVARFRTSLGCLALGLDCLAGGRRQLKPCHQLESNRQATDLKRPIMVLRLSAAAVARSRRRPGLRLPGPGRLPPRPHAYRHTRSGPCMAAQVSACLSASAPQRRRVRAGEATLRRCGTAGPAISTDWRSRGVRIDASATQGSSRTVEGSPMGGVHARRSRRPARLDW